MIRHLAKQYAVWRGENGFFSRANSLYRITQICRYGSIPVR